MIKRATFMRNFKADTDFPAFFKNILRPVTMTNFVQLLLLSWICSSNISSL